LDMDTFSHNRLTALEKKFMIYDRLIINHE